MKILFNEAIDNMAMNNILTDYRLAQCSLLTNISICCTMGSVILRNLRSVGVGRLGVGSLQCKGGSAAALLWDEEKHFSLPWVKQQQLQWVYFVLCHLQKWHRILQMWVAGDCFVLSGNRVGIWNGMGSGLSAHPWDHPLPNLPCWLHWLSLSGCSTAYL